MRNFREQLREAMAARGDAVPKRGNRLVQTGTLLAMAVFGWRIEASVPNLPKFVLVGAPHTSNWDFVLAMLTVLALGIRISWMGKHTLFRPPFGWFYTWLGGVPIERDSKSGIVEQIIETFKKRDRFIIGVTPEGTRKKVKEWKTGFYHIAEGAKVPLVMVRFDYGRRVMAVGPTFEPSGDLDGDLTKIKALFEGVQGRFPGYYEA